MIIPIGLIVMIMLDFFKNVIASKDDVMRKNLNMVIKRIIMCVAVFLVPTIVKVLVGIVDSSDTSLSVSYSTCITNATLSKIEYYEGEEEAIKLEEKAIKEEELKKALTEDKSGSSPSSGTIISDGDSEEDSSSESSSDDSSSDGTELDEKNASAQEFLNSLDKMSKTVATAYKNNKPWHYSGTFRNTFESAMKKGKTLDCAIYVSYALIDIGILDKKSRFWKASSNKIEYRGSAETKMKKKLKYISGNGKTAKELVSEGKLKAGDIVLWNNVQHTNVYAGDKKWYDAGHFYSMNGCSRDKGNLYKTLGPGKIDTLWDNWGVWKILRIK